MSFPLSLTRTCWIILLNLPSFCVTCAKIVQPSQLPPTEVLIIEQFKLQNRAKTDRHDQKPLLSLQVQVSAASLTIWTLFSSSWGMANVDEGTCVRGQAPACKKSRRYAKSVNFCIFSTVRFRLSHCRPVIRRSGNWSPGPPPSPASW